ncbi:hypothetical protein Tsp_16100 [Trichinella spiralis]|uniref:hypothetical protein n=1 Tax=Trichinella spiralis TaxID=6334 RepID=UPI0001EFDD00|nr:hypothetical protein Tsp_16100 [Trichinella spiralis]
MTSVSRDGKLLILYPYVDVVIHGTLAISIKLGGRTSALTTQFTNITFMTNPLGGIVPSGLNIQVKSSKNDPSSISEFSVAITFAVFEKLMMFSHTPAEYVSLKSVNECVLVQDVKFEGLLYFVVAYKITMLPYFNSACALH